MPAKRSEFHPALLSGFCVFIILFLFSCTQSETKITDNRKPDDNRFTPVVLTQMGDFDEPMNFEVLKDGKVYINERKGALKMYDPISKTVTVIGNIPVNTKYTSADGVVTEAEEGFMGFTVDPQFEKNHWAYLYYAHPTIKKDVLSRWEIINDKLVPGSEKVLLEFPTQREVCCHTGGGMTWDKAGDLYLTVGNNTGNVAEKSQTDERPGRSSWDDQRGSGNTNDLRGKILRIHPEPDGSYSIPDGNLFPKGTPKTRPEIYVMGDRNPWRPSIDSKTGWLYWGEVGPDANEDTKTTRMGMDELNQARKPGNFGWPYFIGENVGYPFYNYVTDSLYGPKDPAKPINNSVNNTGLNQLPPAMPAFISYPYGISEKFPEVGTGSRCAVGGPIYHHDDFKHAARPFPDYYEGKWLAADLSRGWIMAITMKPNGDYQSMERFLPSYQPIEPIDIKFGPDGDLYVLEYGSNWFRKSENAKLVRIEYNAG
ncbi:MAG TPA: PQQ-dependent sugar dehydrogenase, partial [Puia sp.]|nr:PQQ-dependent sugar dehydrogenase [Puia sp.]